MIKVLLIDDDARLHSLMRHIAEEHGWNLVGVRSGQEGLDALARERPDVVILDIMMPRMNGFEVCRRIRQVNETVPVLFLSAKQDIVDKSIGFGAGADDFIVKPFDPDELALRVEAHCRRRKSLADGAPSQRTGTMTVGDLEFSFDSYEVRKRGKVVPLTSKEYEMRGASGLQPGQGVHPRADPMPTSGVSVPRRRRPPSPCSCARSARSWRTTPPSPTTSKPSGA